MDTATVTSAQVGSGLAKAFDALQGTEIDSTPVSGSDSGTGTTYTYAILGFAFCTPGNPFAAPVSPAPAGQTVYGCANTVSGSAVMDTVGKTLTVSLTADSLFIDFTASVTVLGVTSSYDGALIATSPSLTVTYEVLAQLDGNYKLGTVASSSFTGTWSASTNPSLAGALLDLLMPLVEATANARVSAVVGALASTYAPTVVEITP